MDNFRETDWLKTFMWVLFVIIMIAMLSFIFSGRAFAKGAIHPGVSRWGIKTTGDLGQTPIRARIQTLLAVKADGILANDKRYQSHRIPTPLGPPGHKLVEGKLYAVQAYLHLAVEEPDGDYHVQLAATSRDQSRCFIVEVPRPEYATSLDIEATRHFLDTLYNGKVPSRQQQGWRRSTQSARWRR